VSVRGFVRESDRASRPESKTLLALGGDAWCLRTNKTQAGNQDAAQDEIYNRVYNFSHLKPIPSEITLQVV
jgi:hypothetical protein